MNWGETMEAESINEGLLSEKQMEDAQAGPEAVSQPLRTPLYDEHLSLGARMVEFGGWMMPVQYSKGITEEHKAVRSGIGIFDTCHMGEFVLVGRDAALLANIATTNNVAALGLVQAQYSFMCNRDGGVIDDCIVYNFGDHTFICVNAAPLLSDFAWLKQLRDERGLDVELINESEETGKLDVQGPGAAAML